MVSYQLLNKYGEKLRITIDESAKEDFKKMMEWTQEDFERHTVLREE